jgi:hypothetical protein
LDDVERDALASHLDGVRVAELVRGDAAPDTSRHREAPQGRADGRGRPRSADGRAVDDAQEGADGKGDAVVQPRLDLLPGPAVHSYLAALAALAATDQDAPHQLRNAHAVEMAREGVPLALAGALWTLASPQLAFAYAATAMVVAITLLTAGRLSRASRPVPPPCGQQPRPSCCTQRAWSLLDLLGKARRASPPPPAPSRAPPRI